MVRLLLKKTLRDLHRGLATYLICIVVVAMGFAGYCVMSVASDHLTASQAYLYRESRFSEVFVKVYEAPKAAERELEKIVGVREANGRLVETVRVSGLREKEREVELQLISTQEGGLNFPLIYQGTAAGSDRREAVIGDAFMKAWKLKPGDTLTLLIRGQEVPVEVAGSGISPENIYMVKSIVDMLPDPYSYDAAFLSYEQLGQILGKEGRANDFVLTLDPGVQLSDVKDEIEEVLKPYGCYSVVDRSEQVSASLLDSELTQIGRMSKVVPFMFLFVAAIILYISLNRLISQQRVQVGTLMALGFSRKKVMLHYMSYGAVVGALGGFLGGLLGNWAAGPLVEFFRVYFNMPDVSAPVSMKYLIFGTLLAFVFCSLVAGRCARGLGSLHPAEALRPEAPAAVRVSWLERIPGFLNLLTVPGVMAVRGLARNRRRSLFSILGIASAFMITASLVSMNTLMDAFIFDYLEKMQQQDLAVYFDIPISEQDALGAVKSREVELAEGIVEAPVTLRGLAGELDCTVRAIEPDAQLTRLYREDGSSVQVQEEGIVISEHQARRLGVSRGDILEVKLSYPEERISRVRITDTIAQYLGETVYMSKEGLARVSDYWNVCTAVLLKAPEQVQEELADNLRNSPLVTGIQTRSQLVDKYRGMMGSIEIMMGSMASMGVLIGLAVIYTSSLISYEELKRELCVMLMLGVRSRLCLDVIRVGQLLLTAAGIVIGIPMTLGVSSLMSSTMATETYSIPNFVDTRSVVLAIGLTFAAAALSSELILRKLKKITPAELLRERE